MVTAEEAHNWLPIAIVVFAILAIFQATIMAYGAAIADWMGAGLNSDSFQLKPIAFGLLFFLIILFAVSLVSILRGAEFNKRMFVTHSTVILMLFFMVWVVNSYFAIFV